MPDVLPVEADDGTTLIADATDDAAKVQPAGAVIEGDCYALGDPQTATHQALLDALNAYRIANGVEPLIYSRRLEAAADAMVLDLWERDFFAHVNPDGDGPGDRALAAGFCHKYVGENLAAGQRSIPAVMEAWKNSPGHNANMLEPRYKYVGVGFSVDANGRLYWAQEFAYQLP